MVSLPFQRGPKPGVLGHLIRLRAHSCSAHLGLVQLQILERRDRFDHLAAGAEVVKLGLRQGQHGAGERIQEGILQRGPVAEAQTKMGIKFIGRGTPPREGLGFLIPTTFGHQHLHSPLAQEPHPGVHQAEIVLPQSPDFCGRGLLQEKGEFRGVLARGTEHPEVPGLFRCQPHSETEDIHGRERGQVVGKSQEDIPARDHCNRAGGGLGKHPLVFRGLEVEQILIKPLAARPAKDRDRHEELATRGIGRKAPALASRVHDQLPALAQPFPEGQVGARLAPGGDQQIRRSAAGAERHLRRVTGREPFRSPPPLQSLKLCRHSGRQCQQILERLRRLQHGATMISATLVPCRDCFRA